MMKYLKSHKLAIIIVITILALLVLLMKLPLGKLSVNSSENYYFTENSQASVSRRLGNNTVTVVGPLSYTRTKVFVLPFVNKNITPTPDENTDLTPVKIMENMVAKGGEINFSVTDCKLFGNNKYIVCLVGQGAASPGSIEFTKYGWRSIQDVSKITDTEAIKYYNDLGKKVGGA